MVTAKAKLTNRVLWAKLVNIRIYKSNWWHLLYRWVHRLVESDSDEDDRVHTKSDIINWNFELLWTLFLFELYWNITEKLFLNFTRITTMLVFKWKITMKWEKTEINKYNYYRAPPIFVMGGLIIRIGPPNNWIFRNWAPPMLKRDWRPCQI